MSELTRAFEIGYGTIDGGYDFAEGTLGLPFEGRTQDVLVYDGDLEYLGVQDRHATPDVALVDPQGQGLPTAYVHADGDLSLATGPTITWQESDRQCGCNGRKDPEEPGGWVFTGNYGDPSYPECDRCGGPEDGDGLVTSPGCSIRLYEAVSMTFDHHPTFHGLLLVAHLEAGHMLEVHDPDDVPA